MSLNAEQLFALLPAVYRTRDGDRAASCRRCSQCSPAQIGIVEDNIQQLYDDQFIETCAPWVIPYIGDLIGYNSIYEVARARPTAAPRSRTRSATGAARARCWRSSRSPDVSGRAAVAVEEFRRLITTESMRHVRPRHASTFDLRHTSALDRLGTAFDPAAEPSMCAVLRLACESLLTLTPLRWTSAFTAPAARTSRTSPFICGD